MRSDYKQAGGTCLLSSYAFLLEYAGVFQQGNGIASVYDVFTAYMRFHNTLEPIECFTVEEIRQDRKEKERAVGKLINTYCHTHGHIAGYQQIRRFHKWLLDEGVLSGIEIVTVKPPLGRDRSKPIPNAYSILSGYLRKGGGPSYYGALILFLAGKGAHTVFLGHDGDFFIRDSNYSCVTGNTASFGFSFNEHSPITEYMVFRIRTGNAG